MATEHLPGGLTLELPKGCFPLSTDSMVLAHFAKARGRIADLGAGAGTLGMLLLSSGARAVTGVELSPIAHEGALANIARNQLEEKLRSVQGDLRNIRDLLPAGGFDGCVSNPPYFPVSGSQAGKITLARREDCCSLEDIFAAAQWLLRTGGAFWLVHKPERLADLLYYGRVRQLEAKRLRFVRHSPEKPVNLVLVEYKKLGKPGLTLEPELILRNADGSPTAAWREIYEGGESCPEH